MIHLWVLFLFHFLFIHFFSSVGLKEYTLHNKVSCTEVERKKKKVLLLSLLAGVVIDEDSSRSE